MSQIVKANQNVLPVIYRPKKSGIKKIDYKIVTPAPRIDLSRWVEDSQSERLLSSVLYDDCWDSVFEFKASRRNKRDGVDDETEAFRRRVNRAESIISAFLAQALNAHTEVAVPAGRIDLVTSTALIEVKVIQHWKHGLGQVLAYSRFVEREQKVLFLFGIDAGVDRYVINAVCSAFDVQVDYSFVFEG